MHWQNPKVLYVLFFCDLVCWLILTELTNENEKKKKKEEKSKQKYIWSKQLLEMTLFDKIIYWK